MQSIRIVLGFGLFLVVAIPGAAQTPQGQPAEQKPLNPTQDLAKEQPEGPAPPILIFAGPASHSPRSNTARPSSSRPARRSR